MPASDLTEEARILYSSDSILDILGYTPDEIVNRSAWEFFPVEELPYAKNFHQHGIAMDRAAMLSYCRVKNKNGEWIGCECCFTIVYDVMVVCTSIYRRGLPSQSTYRSKRMVSVDANSVEERAADAPIIRRLFSSSPSDPRYHMLSHISQKFTQSPKVELHEPRAALFLNRFTRTLTIMYATSGLEDVIGIPAEAMKGKSFYYCIAENCLQDAVKCLENAKSNDSIAYLRFWFRDPRLDDPSTGGVTDDSDEEMTTDTSVDQEYEGGVGLEDGVSPESDRSAHSNAVRSTNSMDIDEPGLQTRTSSGDSAEPNDTHEAIFGTARAAESMASSATSPASSRAPSHTRARTRAQTDSIELEAVISCASDGLVVCLRRARPMLPQSTQQSARPVYENGLFAAPWALEPLVPALDSRPKYGSTSRFAPSLGPMNAQKDARVGGPEQQDFMNSIKEQAIFAWALTGINGSLHRYSGGTPQGESLPSLGLPIWQSDYDGDVREQRTDSASSGISSNKKPPSIPSGPSPTGSSRDPFGDPGLYKNPSSRLHSAGSNYMSNG